MEFLSEKELWRRFGTARRARVRELVSMGIPEAAAKAQASNEFSIYDRILVDERGWMRIEGLELSAPEVPQKGRARIGGRGSSRARTRSHGKGP